MARTMTGGPMKGDAPKKQGKIGEAVDRMRVGRMGKLEAKSEMAADQGNAVKSKRLSNRAEKVGNRMELKAVKKGGAGILPSGKKIGEYIGKGISEGIAKPMLKGIGDSMEKTIPEPKDDMDRYKKYSASQIKRIGKTMYD